MELRELERLIVRAKAAAYVGGAAPQISSRSGSRDIGYKDGRWRYVDSYFGGTHFSGQEVVWFDDVPVWAMGYYGTIVAPDLIDAHRAGTVIKKALAQLYIREHRFLGGFSFEHAFGRYVDTNAGDCDRFAGREHIFVNDREAYFLHYQGGVIA